jgi:hypothetical protein
MTELQQLQMKAERQRDGFAAVYLGVMAAFSAYILVERLTDDFWTGFAASQTLAFFLVWLAVILRRARNDGAR